MAYTAKNIAVLEGLEPVRARPGMYIGSTGVRGLNHLIYEIVDNSVDEALAGFCSNIKVTLNSDGSCTVEDDGRGIPVGMHEKGIPAVRLVLTTLHAGGKFDNQTYKTSGGLHGVGSSVVNALSKWLDVEISQNGFVHRDHYEQGRPTEKLINGLLPTVRKTKSTGTKITFLPDDEIFEKIVFKASDIESRLHETAYLNPNLTIEFINNRKGEEKSIVFHEPNGLKGFLTEMNSNAISIHEPITFKGSYSDGKTPPIEMECAFQYTDDFHEDILGFCNNIFNGEGGTHITGFKTALTSVFNSYARELGILKDKDENFMGSDIRTGLTAIIAIKHQDPRFEGQTKTKLDNPDAAKACQKITEEQITLFFDKNLDILKKVLANAERSARMRKNESKMKENLLTKKKFSFDSNGKLANCESKDASKCEIFIVEGDSAGGSAKTARNRLYQAILPIRGKILNVEKANMNKILANAEIKTMIYAFGCGFSEGYGNDFNIEKLRYDKIIFMADADIDGSHINTLLLTLFYRFMPELIKEGHVYLAMPPLYKAKSGKTETYLYSDKELDEYRKTHKGFELQRYKGLGEMDAEQLWETTMNPETRFLKRVNIEDAKQASEITAVLMGDEVAPRKDFIYNNAQNALLDI